MRLLVALALLLSLSTAAARPVSVTFYAPTGNTPACGAQRLPRGTVQVAVSRDLRASYPCGTRVGLWLARPVGGRWVLTGIVGDTTGRGARNTVDVLVSSSAQAVRYGRVSGTLRRVP